MIEIIKKAKNIIQSLIYKISGSRPWSFGYWSHLKLQVNKALENAVIRGCFLSGTSLPDNYGARLDERIIEYPWAFSKIQTGRTIRKVLDAGSTFNFGYLLTRPEFKGKELTIMTLAPEKNCLHYLGVSYQYGDIRHTPFLKDWFDEIYSLSVLEHIGMDNKMLYTSNPEYKQKSTDEYLSALMELKRILVPDGWLHISVPYGIYEDHGFMQQFNESMVQNILNKFQARTAEVKYYKYLPSGWNLSDALGCSQARYYNFHSYNNKGFNPDGAAAARAVVCISLQK